MALISKAYHFHSTLEIIWCPKLDTYGIAKNLSIEYRSPPRKDRQLLIHQNPSLSGFLIKMPSFSFAFNPILRSPYFSVSDPIMIASPRVSS
jgi:hypothetical protein